MTRWIDVGAAADVPREDVVGVDADGMRLAVYCSPEGRFYASDGLCTHEHVPLEEGFVIDHVIECPRHNGRFDYTSGKGQGSPICVDLRTYPVRIDDGRILVDLDG